MLHRGRSSGAEVIVLRRPVDQGIRFTMADRIEIARRSAALAGADVPRLVIHERLPWDPPELGDYLSVYRDGKPWACCCVARERGRLLAWCAISGRELGPFETMGAALDATLGPQEEMEQDRPWIAPATPRSLRGLALAGLD